MCIIYVCVKGCLNKYISAASWPPNKIPSSAPIGNADNFMKIWNSSFKFNKSAWIPIVSKTFSFFRIYFMSFISCSKLLICNKEILQIHDSRHLGTYNNGFIQHNSCGPSKFTRWKQTDQSVKKSSLRED